MYCLHSMYTLYGETSHNYNEMQVILCEVNIGNYIYILSCLYLNENEKLVKKIN